MLQYRMEHKGAQQFVAVKRAFSNETSLDQHGGSIPEFWEDCSARGLIEPVKALCAPGKGDLYGLCVPLRDSERGFYYGIGVKAGKDTDQAGLEKLFASGGYAAWQTEPADYAVFPCTGPDGECLGEAWERFFKEFCPQTGYCQTDATDYEVYFENGKPGLFCELWVPVKKDQSEGRAG